MVDQLPPNLTPHTGEDKMQPPQEVSSGAAGVSAQGTVNPQPVPQSKLQPVQTTAPVSGAQPAAMQPAPSGRPPHLPAQPPAKKKPLLSKKMYALLLLLLLFLGVSSVPNVKDIPVLSTLARAMGYSEEQMASISFLKALFYWADDERGPQARQEKNAYGVFSTQAGRFDALSRGAGAYGAVGNETSALIDMRAVNASLYGQGKAADRVKGAAKTGAEEEKNKGVRFNRAGKLNALSSDAQASAKVQPDMYYGTDSNAIMRDPKNAYNGSADLKKLKANIVGSVHSDWKNDILRKAMREETVTLDKKLGGAGSALMNLENARGSVADFRYVWLTSQAAQRAKQVPLKKTLAAAGLVGSDMPQKIFTASGGIAMAGLEADDVVADVGNAKLQEKRQMECEQASKTFGGEINNTVSDVKNKVNALQGTFPNFPADCGNPSKVSAWRTALADVRNSCKSVKGNYDKLNEKCMMEFSYKQNREGQCTTLNLDDKLDEFDKACVEYAKYQNDKQAAEEEAERTGEEAKEVNLEDYVPNPEQFSDQEVTQSVQGTFNIPVWGGNATSTPSDFFPETDLSDTKNWSYLDENTQKRK